MFFPDRVKPLPDDRVLEVGPGAMPHSRSQTFLDMRFADDEAFRQRGGLPPVEFTKPVIYYHGGKFLFAIASLITSSALTCSSTPKIRKPF